jgi:anti-sigma B factor antagonist
MTSQPVCSVSVDGRGATPVVRVAGEVDLATSPQLRAALAGPPVDPSGRTIVDLCDVTFLDSTALSALVTAHVRFLDAGGDLRLVVDSPPVKRILAVTGLDQTFSIFPSVARAEETAAA